MSKEIFRKGDYSIIEMGGHYFLRHGYKVIYSSKDDKEIKHYLKKIMEQNDERIAANDRAIKAQD